MASSHIRSPLFLSLTFYGQNQIVVNTNGNEPLVENALNLISEALGPFRATQGYLDCAHPSFILTHAQGIPFGRKNGFSERRNLCVSLCGLFGGLHARGWRAASKCNLDARKRRSSILFAFSPQQPPSDAEYACATVSGDGEMLIHVVPTWAESDMTERTKQHTAHPIGALYSRYLFKPFPATNANVTYAAAAHQVPHFKSSTPKEFSRTMGLTLAVIGAMKDVGFDLELSFSVFGDQQDILMFGYKSKPKRRNTTLWAMTVRQPNLLDLVNCPPNVERSIRKHRHSEPLWGYTTALSQDGVIFASGADAGKQAICKLLQFLELRNWQVIATYDGLYKNSFFIFSRPETTIQETDYRSSGLPWMIGVSVTSGKKIRFDDSGCLLARNPGEEFNPNTIAALGAFRSVGDRTKKNELCIRQLPRDILAYSNVETVSRQADLYLSLAVAFAGAGYAPLGGANISGRSSADLNHAGDETSYGPHTWFLVKRPRRTRPPDFEEAEFESGLPSYDEALSLAFGYASD